MSVAANDPIFGDPDIDVAPPIWNPFTSSDDDVLDDEPDIESTIDLGFLRAIWGPAGSFHALCWQPPGSGTPGLPYKTFDDPDRLAAHAENLTANNLWVSINAMAVQPIKRGGAADVTEATGLYVDLDWQDDAHSNPGKYPTEAEVRERLAGFDIAPTYVICSGHGLQAFWLTTQPMRPDVFEGLQARLSVALTAVGLVCEAMDLPRILRLPGSTNYKREPVPVVIETTGHLHTEAELEQRLPATPTVPTPAPTNNIATSFGPGPFGLVLEQLDLRTELLRRGFEPAGKDDLGELLKHPAATNAVSVRINTSGRLYVFSESLPLPAGTKAAPTTYDALDVIVAYSARHHGGTPTTEQRTAAARELAPSLGVEWSNISTTGLDFDGETGTPPATLNLSDEFWAARPWLTHVRQAAYSRLEAPDAVLGCLLARYATTIPTRMMIPPIVGARATFDHLSVNVGESGGGKSVAMQISKELFPGPTLDGSANHPDGIVWDLPIPTGEGLVSSFFELCEEDDGKTKKKVNKQTKKAVHFSIDEAMSLVQSGAQRQGSTIASVLCAAWTGQNPGQANASGERRRILEPGTFRMSGVMGIQTKLGHNLLTPEWIDQGLAGRLLFFSTEDVRITADAPEWPGPLALPIHDAIPMDLEYPKQIWDEVRDAHVAKKNKSMVVAAIDGHRSLVRLKLAGILALMDGRTAVNIADWDLANQIVKVHASIRDSMLALASESRWADSVTKATASGRLEAVRQEATDGTNIKRAIKSILRQLTTGQRSRKQLRSGLSGAALRQVIDEALDRLTDTGQIKETAGIYELSRGR